MKKSLMLCLVAGLLSFNCHAKPTVVTNALSCNPLQGDNIAGCFTNKSDDSISNTEKLNLWVTVSKDNGKNHAVRYDLPSLQINHNILVSYSSKRMKDEKVTFISASLNTDDDGHTLENCFFNIYPNTNSIQNVKVVGSWKKKDLHCEK